MATISQKIMKKLSVVEIRNPDNKWYYEELCAYKKILQDTLTERKIACATRVCTTLGIHTDQPLTYAYLSQLEYFLNINIYVVCALKGSNKYKTCRNVRTPSVFFLHMIRQYSLVKTTRVFQTNLTTIDTEHLALCRKQQRKIIK